MDIQSIKQRYQIVGNDTKLLEALNKAIQVAPTDLSILVTGESGVGKDVFARIIHDNSERKHARGGKGVVSVNCGAIPEGTIESELFGHLKGSFTGAEKDRKGYFEEANGGTIFLDEVGELPLSTQVKLLRVLENGEITPVGSSTSRKVDVRVVAATNVDILKNIRSGHFREDLYYRLNQIPIYIPPLRERKDDIPLLFRKFASDTAERYNMPLITLDDDAKRLITNYPWYGNIRELKNVTEQMSIIESDRVITRSILEKYLLDIPSETMPALIGGGNNPNTATISDRELLLKALTMGQMITEMRDEINSLRQTVAQLAQIVGLQSGAPIDITTPHHGIDHTTEIPLLSPSATMQPPAVGSSYTPGYPQQSDLDNYIQDSEVVDELPLAVEERERLAIIKALKKHHNNRQLAAKELHISTRTLYRKLKQMNI